MTNSAFHIVGSAKSNQCSTDELLFLFHILRLETAFKACHLRCQIVSELNKQSKNFITLLTVVEDFTAFEKLDRPSVLFIASSQQIQVDRFTSTKETLKTAIITHFAQGACCCNGCSDNHGHNTCMETMNCVLGSDYNKDSGDLHTLRSQLICDWLTQQHKKLS